MADTIAAIATARGQAALAIVRLSGPQAVAIADTRFRGHDLSSAASHTAHVGYFQNALGDDIDQVVVTLFLAPRSVTGEDVVEISCHGGDWASQHILDSLASAGARLAEPGEFTQRAFLNGKMDLAQAEAIADLIHASSSMAHRVALHQLQGRYSEQLEALREELLNLSAFVELELDFSEEDVEFADRSRLTGVLENASALITKLLDTYQMGEWVRDGVRVVIGGRPNAGKSTLLNAMLGRDRAIVSSTPGTTRDEIEAELEIDGLRFRFVDTAGLRATADVIEAEGVRRAQASIDTAHILLYVYDLALGLDEGETEMLDQLAQDHPDLGVIIVANKADLAPLADTPGQETFQTVSLSASEARDDAAILQPLFSQLREQIAGGLQAAEVSPVVVNQRHRRHLEQALQALTQARAGVEANISGDTLALDLRAALHELGQITGAITNEDVLGQIFSRFCIGK